MRIVLLTLGLFVLYVSATDVQVENNEDDLTTDVEIDNGDLSVVDGGAALERSKRGIDLFALLKPPAAKPKARVS
ncbi:unnamed protein product [Nippostrongylus brasiliensis]|uniref:RxLR effector protein n=1 Tax=Nippostrongylus brasiliensis TaxID=27835 RepID=A0A0N4YPM0_NIPBR|nr:unnamed protein product [Nippostrongylus brasiliensis]